MMQALHIALLALLTVAAVALFGYITSDDEKNFFYGEPEALGQGTARAFVALDGNGEPVSLGVVLTEAALSGLPAHTEHGLAYEVVLALPASVDVPPFNHVTVDWNPQGHIPEGIYDQPHFDVHFYMPSETERDLIVPTDAAFVAKSERAPEAQYIPTGYISPPGNLPAPRMGMHWVRATAPELNGEPFAQTFIYGFYDGQMNFLEPMVTKAFLESKPNVTERVALPKTFARAGYYPTHYRVRYDEDEKAYTIALEGLTRHQ